MIIFNKGHISHYINKNFKKEVGNMKNIFTKNERIGEEK